MVHQIVHQTRRIPGMYCSASILRLDLGLGHGAMRSEVSYSVKLPKLILLYVFSYRVALSDLVQSVISALGRIQWTVFSKCLGV
jgi:hypothetical protein